MRMNKFLICLCCLALAVLATKSGYGQVIIDSTITPIKSPDKNYFFQFYQKQFPDGTRTLNYKIDYKGKTVIRESEIDIQLDNNLSERAMALKVDAHKKWCENLQVRKVVASSRDNSWAPVHGERSVIKDRYETITIEMVKDDNPIYLINLEIRVYNEGTAFRFFFPENAKGTYYRVMNEHTEFSLPEGTMAWHASWAQAPYKLLPLNNWPDESERPLTLQLPNGLYACLAEAQMVDYARTKFKLSKEKASTIVTSMYTPADLISPFGTPWRVIMAAEKAGDLITNNDIIQNLNTSSKITDTSWIKPGKIMRVMTQTTKAAYENIDFAVRHHLQYILFDWKWYGPAYSFNSDATKVAIPNFDLPAIIEYGRQKGIGVWLYCNLQGLYAQSDSLFRVYHQWGIKGVKFGFVQVGSHRWTTWLEEMIKKAAKNKIMVNIHDDWRPTGEQRTWPNLMTAEGVRGNEEMPDASNNTILPFTRYLAGPADYTICYFDKRIKNTHAHQLALAAIYYSPIQTLYWYDSPASENNDPELEFWDKIPVVWDETKVLAGIPGQFISTARRKGDEWFIGTITNTETRTVKVDFGFLQKGKKYVATIYSDDDTVPTATKVKIEKKAVDSSARLDINLRPSGGQAIWLQPVDR